MGDAVRTPSSAGSSVSCRRRRFLQIESDIDVAPEGGILL